MEIHPVAAAGFADAERYERGRPEYPAAAIEVLRSELGMGPGRRVLDVGAGTGKLTRRLLALGAEVVAVEPLESMRALLPAEAGVLAAVAEELPLPDRSVDAAVAGDAWHWFDAERAARELARVLRPGGAVALLFTAPAADAEPPEWARRLGELVAARRPHDAPWVEGGRGAVDGRNGFAPLRLHAVRADHEMEREDVVAYVSTMSFIAGLPDDERRLVLDRVRAMLPEGRIRIPRTTEIWVTGLEQSPPPR